MEKIISIEEVFGLKIDACKYSEYDGYEVKTTERSIKILIDNMPCCCEDFGYLTSEDDPNMFIGATLVGVTITNEALETTKLKLKNGYIDECSCIFVNFQTTKGLFQLVAYNEHNGYYGHDVYVLSNEEVLERECL